VARIKRRSSGVPDLKSRAAYYLASGMGRFSTLFPISVGYWLSDRFGDAVWALFPAYRASKTPKATFQAKKEVPNETIANIQKFFKKVN